MHQGTATMLDKRTITWLREERQHIRNRAVDLCTWKVLLPGGLLLLFWPIYAVIMEVKEPYVRAFAHGDYILFAALLLFETSVESERLIRQTAIFRLYRNGVRILAVAMIFVFGFLKYDVVVKEAALSHLEQSSVSQLDRTSALTVVAKLHSYSTFSCAVALLTAAYSIYAFTSLVEHESADLFRRLGDTR
jgi:hypothetical protein